MSIQVNVCLSGGGARGFAHLGLIQAFQEAGVEVCAYSGSSSGALAAAFLCAGYQPGHVLELFRKKSIFRMLNGAFNQGLLTMNKGVAEFYREYLPATFEELKIPLWVCATDLLAGEAVYFHRGSLVETIVGSCSVPGLFKPVLLESRMLVDGGVLNNLPVEPLLDKPLKLIGIHVNPVAVIPEPKGTMSILERSFHLGVYSNIEERRKRCSLFLEPPELSAFRVFEYERAAEMYAIGYAYGRAQMQAIKEVLE